jgi:DNA-binding NtrC family response regulator
MLSDQALATLLQYDWPGNIRELENCVQHMVAVNSGPVLEIGDMPSTVISQTHVARSPLLGLAAAVGDINAGPEESEEAHPILPLPAIERREILRAIQHTRGDRTAAAALLQIGRTTLYRKLKEYGFSD